ncbi:MAG: AMP-binding protein [Desulfobacterales bacterium]|jgi:acyl-CoA synthetase (AMP-forming)/AMP-acid ligase II
MRELTLYDIYKRNSTLHGGRTALRWAADRMTYRDLLIQTDGVAAGLARQGIARGDRIAILANNHYRFFSLFGAAARMGVGLVPLNWRLSDEEIRFILSDAEPSLLLTDQAHSERAGQTAEGTRLADRIIGLDREAGWPVSLDDMPSEPIETLPEGRGSDIFCLIYTAAVAGKPRGAVLSQSNMVFSNLQTLATLTLGNDDGYLNSLPLFHITGLNLSLAVLHAGGENVVVDRFDAEETVRWVTDEGVTVLGSFPPMLTRVLAACEEDTHRLSSLKHVMGLDAPDVIAAFEAASGAVFWMLYGQTETSGMVTLGPAGERPGTAGRQGLLIDYRLVDGNGNALPTGETGEIVVRGPLVFQGFWKQGGGLDTSSIIDGWHYTGDLGRLDEDGYLTFGGRKPEKELIKPGGENVYPAEVEAVIMEHESVADVSVIGVPDPEFGEGVKAVCVLKPGAVLTHQELSRFVASRIAGYKKPRYVDFVDRLPKGTDGKTDREAVKKRHGNP